MLCEEILGYSDNSACAGQLDAYLCEGDCPGSGITPAFSQRYGGSVNSCSVLAGCCNGESFPVGELTSCEQVFGEGSVYACAGALSDYQRLGLCARDAGP